MITGSRGVKIEPQQCLVLWWPCMVNSSKLGISKRKMVVGCSVSSTGGQGAETITESASFVGQGSFSRLGIIITFSLVWTSVKHELSAGGDAEAVLCQSYLLTGWNMRQTCFTVTSTILMNWCKVCTVAWARLSVRVERTVPDVILWCDCHPVLK